MVNALKLEPANRPNFLCIGAAKAGTTWLASVLSAHPDVFIPPQKELNALHYDDLDARLEEYSDYFRDGETCRIRSDFSVRYLSSPNAARAAARLLPDARILAILRNPIDQVQSHYWHLRRQNFHQPVAVRPAPDIFEAIEKFPELLLEPALYGKHLGRWLDLFPRDQVLLLTYDEMTRRTTFALDQICDFLAISRRDFSADASGLSIQDARGGVRPRAGLMENVYPVVYVAATRRLFRPIKLLMGVRSAESIKRKLGLRQLGEKLFFERGYEKLDQTGRAKLLEYFAQDLQSLQKLITNDVSTWAITGTQDRHEAGTLR